MILKANEPNWKRKIREIFHLAIHETSFNAQSRANGGFYEENDEISKNAIAFTADEPKIWEI